MRQKYGLKFCTELVFNDVNGKLNDTKFNARSQRWQRDRIFPGSQIPGFWDFYPKKIPNLKMIVLYSRSINGIFC